MNSANAIDRVILIPGLLEPRMAFAPLRRMLLKRYRSVEYFPDRLIFRDIDRSIQRLGEMLGEGSGDRTTAIVTHSFGDWIARRAIARASSDRQVGALVSVAPVMRRGLMPTLLYLVSGNLIPEIKTIMDRERASECLNCDEGVRRLVIWAKLDECLRSVPLEHIPNVEVQRFAATHLSVIVQPNVLKTIDSYLCSLKSETRQPSPAMQSDSPGESVSSA